MENVTSFSASGRERRVLRILGEGIGSIISSESYRNSQKKNSRYTRGDLPFIALDTPYALGGSFDRINRIKGSRIYWMFQEGFLIYLVTTSHAIIATTVRNQRIERFR